MLRRISGICGVASPLAGLTVIFVAVSNSPWFSWTENDISVLGVEGSMTMLFNWGLIFTGLLSLLFVISLRKNLVSGRMGRLGINGFLLGSVAISATGMLPRSIDVPHDIVSIGAFVCGAWALLMVGVAAITARRMTLGVLSLVGGVLTVVFLFAPWPWTGGAIEQLLACTPWALWTMVFGMRLLLRTQPIVI